ncbi:MAG: hypothetical protein HZB91_07585 [Elusimicrobia bacterium]|nr:hypothetical protein [Elusimicrobiota bacterium]
MTRKALFLAAFSAALLLQVPAQAESRGPVARIFLDQLKGLDDAGSKAAASCEDLRKCAALMTPAQKESARTDLLRLEGRTPSGGLLTEISQGFIALGYPQDAVRMLKMGPFDQSRGGLLTQAASEFQRQGRYELAMAAAQEALDADPKDEAALAVLRLSERRVHKREIASLPVLKDESVEGRPGEGGSRLAALTADPPAISAWPDLPMEVYHLPDTKPPSSWETIVTGVGSLWRVYFHSPSAKEAKDVAALKKSLESLPSGKDLVAEMGGWERVEKEVYFMVTDMSDDGTAAYVRPMTPWEAKKKGKNYVLAINSKLMEAGPEAVLPVFGHELSHVSDKLKGRTEFDLAVTSEHGAHLRQVYLFQEVEKSLTPQRRQEVEKKRIWMYQKWLTSMWEDHLLKLYPKKEDYQKVFSANKNLQYVAGLAYEDIAKKAVKDGTPQVLYHVSDLYANATHEPETTEEALLKKIEAAPDPAKRSALQAMLKKVREMRKGFFSTDEGYRARTGQTLP